MTWTEVIGSAAAVVQLAASIYVLRLSRIVGARQIGWLLFVGFLSSVLLRIYIAVDSIHSTGSRTAEGVEGPLALFSSVVLLAGMVYIERLYLARQASDRARADEHNWLRVLTENLPDSVYVKDAQGRYLFDNPADSRLLGARTPTEVVGKTVFDLIAKEVAQKYHEDDLKVIQSGQPMLDREEPFMGKDGRTGWLLTTKVPLRDPKGVVIGLVGISRDITGRKQAVAELQASEQRFRSIWENSVDGMRLTDATGNIVSVNGSFCRMVGATAREIVGRPFTHCYSEDENLSDMLDRYRRHFGGKTIRSHVERRVKLRSGKTVDLDITNSFIDTSDGQTLLLTLCRDVTERNEVLNALRHSEERFRQLAENIEDVVWMVDTALEKVVYVNPAYERIWERSSESLLANQVTFIDSVHPEDRERVRKMMERQRNGIFQPEEYRVLRGDGSVRWIRDRAFPIKDDQGKVHRIAGIAEDVTDRKRSEAERQSLERKLMDAQKLESLGILAGGIAHDFNNLLTAILGNAALARMEFPPGAPQQPHLANIEKTSQQAAELCKQMLAFSGRGQFIMRKLDLNGIVEEMTHLLQVSINKKNVLKLSLAPNLPPVTIDPAQIRQVILNLIINASEAIGDKSGVIHVTTGMMRADRSYLADTYFSPDLGGGDYVYLEVSDTGCGMTPQTRERIFDPFFSTKFTGRGLGLAAVLGIVRGHKGALKVYSEPGRGSTFKFMLPCAQGAAEPLYPLDLSAAWRGSGLVLVVDDEETVRTVTARILETLGFEVVMAADGAQGVEAFRKHHEKIIVVVLDMTMPHLNGEESFREIRRIRNDARVLLVSGYSERDVTDRFAGKGLSGFLQKPFTPVELRDRLRSIIDHNTTVT